MTGTYGPVLNTHAVCCEDYYFPEVKLKLLIVCVTRRTEGWGGGVGRKTKKKFMQGKMPKKKFIQKEGPIVTFSESLSFRNQQYYQAQYEKTKITFFLLKGDN